MKTINGRRLFDLMEDSVALVVDVKGDGVIASQLNFMKTDTELTVTAVGYIDHKPWEFQLYFAPDAIILINEHGQALIGQADGTHAVSLLNWVDISADRTTADYTGTPLQNAVDEAMHNAVDNGEDPRDHDINEEAVSLASYCWEFETFEPETLIPYIQNWLDRHPKPTT